MESLHVLNQRSTVVRKDLVYESNDQYKIHIVYE